MARASSESAIGTLNPPRSHPATTESDKKDFSANHPIKAEDNNHHKYSRQSSIQSTIVPYLIMDQSSSLVTIPRNAHLKGEENFKQWLNAITNIAESLDAEDILREDYKVPLEENIDARKIWKVKNAKLKSIIMFSCEENGPRGLLQECSTANEMIRTLNNQFRGRGYVLGYNAYQEFISLKISDFENLIQLIIRFKSLIAQMKELNVNLTDLHYHMHFIGLLTDSYPVWADRQRSAARNAKDSNICSLDDLIQDITDEARRIESVSSPGTVFFGNNQGTENRNQKKNKGKFGGNKDSKDGKCKHCECPFKSMNKVKHTEADCLLNPKNVNKKKEWEDKNGKNFVKWGERSHKGHSVSSQKGATFSFGEASAAQVVTVDTNTAMHASLEFNGWLYDTGASVHCTPVRDDFVEYRKFNKHDMMMHPLMTANGIIKPIGIGKCIFSAITSNNVVNKIELLNVLHFPSLPMRLLSGQKHLMHGGYIGKNGEIYKNDGFEFFKLDKKMMVWVTEGLKKPAILMPVLSARNETVNIWHKRFAHISLQNLQKTQKIVNDLPIHEVKGELSPRVCESCELSKSHRTSRKYVESRAIKALERVHVDVVQIKPQGFNGHNYGTLFTDDATRERWFFSHKDKGGAKLAIDCIIKRFQTQWGRIVKVWRLDGGKEYGVTELKKKMDNLGSILEITTPYAADQDGVSERSIRTVLEKAWPLIEDFKIPKYLWPEIIHGVIHILNRTATYSVKNKTPHEAFLDDMRPGEDHKPSVKHFRALGSKAYVHIPKEKRVVSEKLTPRAEVGILVGFEGNHIYRVYVASRSKEKIVRTSSVRFDEHGLVSDVSNDSVHCIPGYKLINIDNRKKMVADSMNPEHPDEELEDEFLVRIPTIPASKSDVEESDKKRNVEPQITTPSKPVRVKKKAEPLPVEKRRPTRASNKARQDIENEKAVSEASCTTAMIVVDTYAHKILTALNVYAAAHTSISDDPKTLDEVLSGSEADLWSAGISSEYNSLHENGVFDLIRIKDLSPNVKILRGKLVFKRKRDKEGNVSRWKVRYVARGFEQMYGRDYDQTFAGVCKSTAWKIPLKIAAMNDLDVDQMDAITAFLNGKIDEDVYIEPGQKQEWACKLKKAIYGLKQAPRLWQSTLCVALAKVGFYPLATDNCVYYNNNTRVIIVIYVDDFLIIGKTAELTKLKAQLMKLFKMDNIGSLSYFLGVRIVRNREERSITLCQDAYVKKILKKFGFEKCTTKATPMEVSALEDMVPFEEKADPQVVKDYQSKVGSLNFLAIQTRPDIAFATGVLSRFLTNPSPQHMKACDRVFRYLAGTINRSIVLGGKGYTALHGYSDSDYAGDISMRRSTSGFVFFLGGGAVSVQSKRQTTVALSSTEAEYYGLTKAAMEASWIRQFLEELGNRSKSVKLFGDNQSSLALAENPEFHQRTKHIAIKHHYKREQVQNGFIDLWFVPTEDMVADGLTKPLPTVKHQHFVEQLRMQDIDLHILEK
ncbi:Gag-Pol polyprotein [Blumeria hordei DH14]|uniref:Gag-Pol polyprotein n=1 Tax=Blumeria graminis f. sp. hordei (strain DH14) TaxID=546991 RepID=N1JEE7_BLUG1|nr:Gag-Pol polyprotein [Blumeria hordei DH14]